MRAASPNPLTTRGLMKTLKFHGIFQLYKIKKNESPYN